MYLVFFRENKTKILLNKMIFPLSTYFWSWSVYIMRTSSMTEAWTTEAKVKNTLKSESAISWPALVYVTWWTKSIQRPGNDDPWSALREIELTSIVLMNRLARGVSSISSKCSSTGACFPFCVSVSYSHTVYNSLFTPSVHPSFFSREKTVTVLTHCRSAGQTCTQWCIRRERLFGLSCQMMSKLQADTKTCYVQYRRWWMFLIYMQKECMLCLMGKKLCEAQWMSRSSRGAPRVLHCLLVYMMLRHLATVADQINLLIWQQRRCSFISWEFRILTGGGQECHF